MTNWRFYLSLLWLLALAVVLTLLTAWLIYPLEIAFFSLTDTVGMAEQTIRSNFNQLMVYLLNPFHNPLKMTDFPVSASGAKHFVDVKRLFILAELICLGLAYPAIKDLNKRLKGRVFQQEQKLVRYMVLAPVVILGLGVLLGFDQFFVLFHNFLFPGDSSWLFDPATDPIILVLPAEFFLHCFLIFGAIYEGLFLGLWVIFTKQSKKAL